MFIYIVVLFLTLFLYNKNMYSKKYAMFVMAILFIVCGLRDYSVGIDTASYVDKYTYNYEFKREDIEELFNIKKSRASEIIAMLLDNNLIEQASPTKYKFKK